jgi:cytochrome P450
MGALAMTAGSNTPERFVDLASDPRAHFALTELARTTPVATDISGLVWVLRHADVERLANDRQLHGVGLTMFDQMGIREGRLRRWYGSMMLTNEGDAHARLRRLVSAAFKPKAVDSLRGAASEIVAEVFSELRHEGGGDLVRAFEYVPMRVMCRLLGVPTGDVPIFGAWCDALSRAFTFMSPEQIAAATEAIGALLGYADELVSRRRRAPHDDLVSDLIAARDEGSRLSHEELLDMVANLLVGGHDTTASQIACSFFELLCHPEILAKLETRPHGIPAAVDETLRLQPAIGILPRTVVQPLEVAGRACAPGTLLCLVTASANRDPAVWERPDDFVLERFERPDAPRVLTFGAGPHYCLGANLARMTLAEAVRGLVQNRCAPARDLAQTEWRMVLGRSPASLPVTLD